MRASGQRIGSTRGDWLLGPSEEVVADQLRIRPDGHKRCRACLAWAPLSGFAMHNSKADGLRDMCRACSSADVMPDVAVTPRKPGTPSASTPRRAFIAEHRPSMRTTYYRETSAGRTRGICCPRCARCNLTKKDTPLVWWAERRFGPNAADVLDRVLDVLPNVGSPATRLV